VNLVSRKLRTSPAVLIEEYGRITGIITRQDLLITARMGIRREHDRTSFKFSQG
jgi:predicted transcriptional regulator